MRQLAHFVAVAEDGSFTRAARRMKIVQSGISASIAALERELGVTLFRRTRHRAELTPAGAALLVEARRALAAVAAGRAAAVAADAAISARLRIGLARALPKRIELPRIIREFKHANPDIDVYVHECPSADIAALRSGDLDLLIGPSPAGETGITSIPLTSSPMRLAVATSHPLASQRLVRLSAAESEQFIDLPEGWAKRRLADRALADAGITRRRVVEAGSVDFALNLVAEGAGVALLPEILAESSTGVTLVPLASPVSSWGLSVSFVGDEPASAAAKSFLELIDLQQR